MAVKELPIYEARINPEDDKIVDMVSIVESPAVTTYNKKLFGEGNFLAFKKQLKEQQLMFSTDDEMTLFGIAMMANEPIYRKVENEEFYVMFSKETISQIVHTFFQKSLNHNLNVDHQKIDAKSYIYQSIIIDEKKGIKAPEQFGEVSDGSWLIGVKVNDPQLWKDIKAGKKNGFSVEGMFELFDRNVWMEVEMDSDVEVKNIDITPIEENEEFNFKSVSNQIEYYLNKLTKTP
ncbi:hypothetical protein CHU00_14845 [Sphingobacterium cellulitidis]|uniref:XkdF-like putative serine protease domain-containing protein n=1 Tax=Sphingobacterium cellulitidis TaxID=1768011 RepID=UPI000B93C901|nr:XkdF-like putative serine protease domain-containing protein [Sphingobacterium cellulitidis]OYD44889.1 hypothetical protein CHU00_14845 [Sphingobacterium cellulitidis]